MNINHDYIESTNENKKPIRPKSSSNKYNMNHIPKLIKDIDFPSIKNPKIMFKSNEKLINLLKNEKKIKNLLSAKKENKNNFFQANSTRAHILEYEMSKKLLLEDQKKIKLLEEKIKEKQKYRESKISQIKNVKDNITKLKESIKEKEKNIEKLDKEIEDCKKKNDDLEKKINDIADELDEIDGEFDLEDSIGIAQPNVDEMTYEQLLELEEQMGNVSNGLTDEEIKALKHDKFIKNKYLEDKCIICQYNFKELEPVVGLPCKHCFHFNCLKPWIEKQHYCPLCKSNIRKEK